MKNVTKIKNQMMTFFISDTGCGFSKKDLANIFEKFYQGDGSRSKEKEHCGLGLYIVNVLVNKFNGNIEVKNSDQGGAGAVVKVEVCRDNYRIDTTFNLIIGQLFN